MISQAPTRAVTVTMTVNGERIERMVQPRILLSDFLRDHLELFGTHVGCEHGICGVCTILVDGRAVRSCLMFAVQAQDADIVTVEGMAQGEDLHPLQTAFREHHGLQCGFCTPGMLATAYEFLQQCPDPDEQQVRVAISGVLCRCTGYKQIVDAVMDAAKRMSSR